MADERAGEIGHAYGWHRIVAKLPVAAVERIHVFALARDHADRIAATNDFAVRAQLGLDAEHALGAGRMRADALPALVDHPHPPGLPRHTSHVLPPPAGAALRPSALNPLPPTRRSPAHPPATAPHHLTPP